MYSPENIELKFGMSCFGAHEANLGTYDFPQFLHDKRTVTRKRMFWGFGKPEPLRRWLVRVQQTRMQMAEEWNAITRAAAGEDVPDPVVNSTDVPEPVFSTSELDALREIGA